MIPIWKADALRGSRVALAAVAFAACSPASDGPPPDAGAGAPAVADSSERATVSADTTTAAQSVYVPIYSRIYYGDARRTIELTATLSVRNTDDVHPITLRGIRYYDSEGRLVRSELESPLVLGPLATRDWVVEERDRAGGAGANFIVEWSARDPVTEPVIEAVMIGQQGAQGISFTSIGRPLHRPR
jgi:hypothetical protein